MTDDHPLFSFATLVRELGLAWTAISVYPPGHQARAGATDEALRQARGLAAATGSFAVGVTKEALMAGDERAGDAHARRLAGRLHELGIGVVRFGHETSAEELESFLVALRPRPGATRGADGELAARLADAGVHSVEVEAVDFSRLVASDDLESDPAAELDAHDGSLWERILGDQLDGAAVGTAAAPPSLAAVLELVNRYLPAETPAAGGPTSGGPAPTGGPDPDAPAAAPELVALARRLASAVGEHAEEATRRGRAQHLRQVGELVGALPRGLREEVLDAALERLGSTESGAATDALRGLETSAGAVDMVASLRRLRQAGRRLAGPAVQWLHGLVESGTLAETTTAVAGGEELAALLAEADDRPALRADEAVLELPPWRAVSPLPDSLRGEVRELAVHARPQALLRTLLELLEVSTDDTQAAAVMARLEQLFATLVQGMRISAAGALLAHLEHVATKRDDAAAAQVRRSLDRLAGESTAALLADLLPTLDDAETAQVRELVERLGEPLRRALLTALGEEEDRARRRVLFDFLVSLSAGVVDDARALLADERWYVVRNMIGLLRSVGNATAVPDLRGCLRHADPRVRSEALRALAELDAHPSADLLVPLLDDEDPRVATLAVQALGQTGRGGEPRALEPLLDLVTPLDPLGRNRELRVRALLALGEAGDPRVLPRIKRYFSALSVDHADERRAAFQSLQGYPPAARAPWLARGARSRDAEVRDLCRRLLREDRRDG